MNKDTRKRNEMFIAHLAENGITVSDSGGKIKPHYVKGIGDLTNDELATVVYTVDMLKHAGRLEQKTLYCPTCTIHTTRKLACGLCGGTEL